MSFKLHLIIDKNNTNKSEAIGNALLNKQYDFVAIPAHELQENEDTVVLELESPGVEVDVIVSEIVKEDVQLKHSVESGLVVSRGQGASVIPQLDNGVFMQYKVREGIITMG